MRGSPGTWDSRSETSDFLQHTATGATSYWINGSPGFHWEGGRGGIRPSLPESCPPPCNSGSHFYILMQTQHNTAQHSTAQRSAAQRSAAQRSAAQHSTAQHSTAQHSTALHSTAQHSTAQHSTAQHSTAQHNTAQHSTAQHSTAQHNTTQHNTTQHNTTQHNTTQHNTMFKKAPEVNSEGLIHKNFWVCMPQAP